ncbi:MAG: hypothetical protein GTN80_07460 [Nitrososphaeria archaeon]|nr:hypothetical protein [Nitrososphaeria archaeon]
MARFYAEIQGNRGLASRMGTKDSGMWGHIRGWNIGVKVVCEVNKDGKDEITLIRTGGSNGRGNQETIAVLTEEYGMEG